ncbi:hypothetical protein Dalu01_02831 [Deinococcus aluminii]|uniref:Uncharacterized protein n=1 Tax=Deinococcus aluminii TaxID=1656885 RepID=A0ABP9XGC8_9DEIO
MKLSVSLPEAQVTFLDCSRQQRGLGIQSEEAWAALKLPQESVLEDESRAAGEERGRAP